jgi:hypothetical protein
VHTGDDTIDAFDDAAPAVVGTARDGVEGEKGSVDCEGGGGHTTVSVARVLLYYLCYVHLCDVY